MNDRKPPLSQYLDEDGQPLIRALNADRRADRAINELVGMLKGLLMDGIINDDEVLGLAAWITRNEEAAQLWPVSILLQRLNRILEDGRIDDEERSELHELALRIIGGERGLVENATTGLPLCDPAPDVIFDQNIFVLTGKFWYGTRKDCEKEIAVRGGRCASDVTMQTSYLVLGGLCSADWYYATHGRKIEKAVKYRIHGQIAIISEAHWETFLLGERGKAAAE